MFWYFAIVVFLCFTSPKIVEVPLTTLYRSPDPHDVPPQVLRAAGAGRRARDPAEGARQEGARDAPLHAGNVIFRNTV